jgi:hypothetical protein
MGPTEYCTTILLPKPSQNLPRISLLKPNQTFRIVSFLGCSPNVNSSWCGKQREGRLIWPYHARVCSCLMLRFSGHETIVYASKLSIIRHLAIEPCCEVGFVNFKSGSFCHLCCSSSVNFRNNPTQCTMISFCERWFIDCINYILTIA